MKKFIFSFLFLFAILPSFAGHIIGGEMYYDYQGAGSTAGTFRYQITLKLYRGTGGAALDPTVTFSIFNTGSNTTFTTISNIALDGPYLINYTTTDPCIVPPQTQIYEIGYYRTTIDLPSTTFGYTVAFQRCCRRSGIVNLNNPTGQGATYFTTIPGIDDLSSGPQNSSPRFSNRDSVVICHDSYFSFDFSANDANGDQLVYYFSPGYNGGGNAAGSGCNAVLPNPPCAPPYSTLNYLAPFSSSSPMGAGVTVNSNTGIVSGVSPGIGFYVVTVACDEYRNGVKFNTHYKEFLIQVSDCSVPQAILDPVGTTCDGFTVSFKNDGSNAGVSSWLWNFGDPSTGINNISNLPNPTHTFSAAGIFTVKLVVNQGQSCSDSATQQYPVFPGFFPGFINSQPLCVNVPVQFADTTKTNYGVTTGWRWDFGNPTVLNDTSHLPNPTYTFPASGTYNVEFIVGNTFGCIDTVYKDVIITDPPPVNLFPHDTTYCGLDSLQLTATGVGNFSWAPASFIIGANTGTPIVFPPIPTKYVVSLNNNGCISKDSLFITPKFDLLNSIAASNNPICEEDTITLTGNSNYTSNLNWQWNPVATLETPSAKVTKAFPVINTTYSLTTTWGQHCIANASIPIVVRPLANPNAGPDAALCNGQGSVQLTATGGVTYHWTPATGLSNPNIANPIAAPGSTTTYIVAVGVTGCSKTREDSVKVTVRALPPLSVTNDTLICSIDTLQLIGNGTGNFVWSPNYMIDNINAPNPLVSPDVPTKYYVRLSDGFGCYSDDSVFVDVKLFVTINAGNDTSLCKTDGFNLTTTSDALHYLWTPSTYLDDPTKKNPFTQPLTTTMYHVVGNIGKCQSEDSVLIKVVPYPPANAGTDRAICPGFNTQLLATGGTNYVWSPTTFLNDRFIANPTALNPTASIRYIVTVTDTLGCPKPVKDTVFVTVYPKTIADAGPRDTSVVEGQPLQLNASGGLTYLWSPPQWLSGLNLPNPVSLPQATIEYIVEATSATGCKDTDSILIRLFKVDPDMYVPNAFTPNGDGINDVIRPILLGMKELRYFKIYNRLGQMVFYTTDIGKGWDGKFGGRGQDPGNFVWVAEGVTYKGLVKQKKGNVILIRQ